MKGCLAMFGLLATVVAVIMLAIIELLAKLAPLLLVAAACVWALVRVVGARRRRRADTDDYLCRPWGQPIDEQSAPAGPPAVTAHRPHLYLVRP
jgi:hypothetical protein